MNVLKHPDKKNLMKLVKLLDEGKLIVYPTDTIYGIGASINNEKAIKKVFLTKGRSFNKPISICFHDLKQLEQYVSFNKSIKEILTQLLPGSYTFIIRKTDKISPLLTSNKDTVGIRIPDNNISKILTSKFPITSTSANLSDKNTPNNIGDIKEQLGDNIDTYIDMGEITNNQASTIIDLTRNKPLIIRKGVCDEKIIQKIRYHYK